MSPLQIQPNGVMQQNESNLKCNGVIRTTSKDKRREPDLYAWTSSWNGLIGQKPKGGREWEREGDSERKAHKEGEGGVGRRRFVWGE